MKVSVLIATRNRPAPLRRCLSSVATQNYKDLEVFLINDAGVPIDKDQLINAAPSLAIHFFRSADSKGPIGCRNFLMKHAKGDLFLILDDDAYLNAPDAVNRAVAAFHTYRDAGILAFQLIERDGEQEHWLLPQGKRKLQKDPTLAHKSALVSHYLAGAHAVRREVIEQCGNFHDGLFYGHEELDLSYRALDANFTIRYIPEVQVYHIPEHTRSSVPSWKLYYLLRNRLLIAYTYLPMPYMLTHMLLWVSWYALQALLQNTPAAYVRGFRDGLFGLRAVARRPIKPETVAYLKTNYGRLWW